MFGKGLLTGMSVTWKHLWGKKETFCYPEEKLPMTDNFRGGNLAMDWRICIGCSMCANACPNKALDLTIVQDAKKKRHMKSYVHKSGRCLYCNLCVEVCPVKTLVWDKDYAISTWSKETMTHDAMTDKDRADLEEFLAQVEVEAAEEKAKKEAAAKAKAEAAAKAKAEAEKAAAENPEAAKPAAEKTAVPADAAEKMAAAKAAAGKAAAAKSQAAEKSAETKAEPSVETKDAEQKGGTA
ncbi:4Fe-4S dicluster domain-containing protein [Selenomonas sp. oral taxon 138]|uniref:4Fe-4S dicluster domain-containing protein n=1 Tax=Selenomonas sp. oral taxon 138 TaxID=712532 RepID=UPI0002A22AFE|nr:4Fe-4S dicluster domain-containing protein [Selenomonas sp. oral taxon 138]EKX94882.1 4Fe-4S binding domain protein [Selenomonas sp. oral taxon 138 str. F0429]